MADFGGRAGSVLSWWARFPPGNAAPIPESMSASRRRVPAPEDGSEGAESNPETGSSAASSCVSARGEIPARRRRPVGAAAGDGLSQQSFASGRRQDTLRVVELGVVCLLLAVVGCGDAALLPSTEGGARRELLQSAAAAAAAAAYTWQVGGVWFAHASQLGVTMRSV